MRKERRPVREENYTEFTHTLGLQSLSQYDLVEMLARFTYSKKRGAREEYKNPKSQVDGYNGAEVLLKLTISDWKNIGSRIN